MRNITAVTISEGFSKEGNMGLKLHEDDVVNQSRCLLNAEYSTIER
jgi:hypothetical protein